MLMLYETTALSMKKMNLKNIHNEGARIVTGDTKRVSIESLNHETGWKSLLNRRKKQKHKLPQRAHDEKMTSY